MGEKVKVPELDLHGREIVSIKLISYISILPLAGQLKICSITYSFISSLFPNKPYQCEPCITQQNFFFFLPPCMPPHPWNWLCRVTQLHQPSRCLGLQFLSALDSTDVEGMRVTKAAIKQMLVSLIIWVFSQLIYCICLLNLHKLAHGKEDYAHMLYSRHPPPVCERIMSLSRWPLPPAVFIF